jgi:hypothetical protein
LFRKPKWLPFTSLVSLKTLTLKAKPNIRIQRGFKLEFKLLEGETIVLDDGYVGYRQKLTLTNKRLIYIKKEGFFSGFERVMEEIPLEQIEEAYTQTSGLLTQSSLAILRMKDGQTRELDVHFGGGDALGMLFAPDMPTENAIRTKTLCDKWVNAINQQLRAKVEDRTQKLEDRIRELEEKLKEKEK